MAEFTHDAAPHPRTPPLDGLIITILGGTGEQGRGLARRFAMAGHPVIIGSRSYNRARAIAQEVGHGICGLANRDATREANLVIVAVPYEGHGELLAGLAAELAGKIVVDCVNPLGFDEGGAYPLPVPEGSAAQQAATLLPGSRVVAAFQRSFQVGPDRFDRVQFRRVRREPEDRQPGPGGDQLAIAPLVWVFRSSQTKTIGPFSCWCAASRRRA